MTSQRTADLLSRLATRPGHDEVKSFFAELLIEEFGVDRTAVNFEVRRAVIAGRMDALIGRTVFEAKRNLDNEIDDVLRRMPDYLADAEREYREPFVGIASDGKTWIVFEMVDGALRRVKDASLDPEKSELFLAWLDGVLALKASLAPDPLTVRAELGHDSIAYRRVDRELRALWERLKTVPAEALKHQLWADLLKLVYGREIEDEALWFQHTYLVIVAKCIALAVMDLPEDDPKRMLSGDAFTAARIGGAVESDFFDWVVADPAGEALVRQIMAHVRRFRLREVESDVLKVLYESLIDRDERHGLGEYYTPDWLAAKVVRNAVTAPLEQKVLDPACGSGTFLFHAIRNVLSEAAEAGTDTTVRAAEACTLVQGIDIHPVAVIIARVTYLLALAPALAQRSGAFNVPVYLGDAMQLSISQMGRDKELVIQVPPPPAGSGSRERLGFPELFCRDPALFDKAIETMRVASLAGRTREQVETTLTHITDEHIKLLPRDAAKLLARRAAPELGDDHRLAIRDLGVTYETFHNLRLAGRDTIWSYVARNLSRPLALASDGGWANVLVGNPPWVAYRNMSAVLQKRFKELAVGERIYVGSIPSHNDLCALFVTRSSHLYLRPGGRLAFVLPLATLTRAQFEKFRTGQYDSYNVAWDEAWTTDVKVGTSGAIFPVPSCVLFGRKRALGKATPRTVREYSGAVPVRDASEAMADKALTVADGVPAPDTAQRTGGSAYRKTFRQGAILIPRAFVLVERKVMGRLGADPAAPRVISRRSTQEKKPWRDVPSLESNVERQFLRPVLLGESILPFRLFRTFEGVVPTTEKGELLNASIALDQGFTHLNRWMALAEESWDVNGKGKRRFIDQLDYIGQLSSQFPVVPIRVAYAASGTQPAALIVRDQTAVIEHILYWGDISTELEANYLCSIFNSETARARAAHFQARGQFGARHFDKVMFNLPIPVFDSKSKLHRDLAAAGAQAETVAGMVEIPGAERFVAARRRVRRALVEDGIAPDIEKLVEKLLGPDAAR